VNDFLRVAAKMWNAVEDCRQGRFVKTLNAAFGQQLLGGQRKHRLGRILNGLFQRTQQFLFGNRAAFGEFGGTIAMIGGAGQARD
jgi:hypothetical protein